MCMALADHSRYSSNVNIWEYAIANNAEYANSLSIENITNVTGNLALTIYINEQGLKLDSQILRSLAFEGIIPRVTQPKQKFTVRM
jgi:hypothetical protein